MTLLTVSDVAARLGCSTRTVRRRIASGDLRAIRDRGLVRVSERELERFVATRLSPTGAAVSAPSSPRRATLSRRAARPEGRLFDEPDRLPPLVV